jgi:hypothetical protein
MNYRILLALSLILPATAALAADGTFDRTLNLTGAATLSISTGSGYVHVYPGPDNRVHIVGHVHGNAGGWFDSDADINDRVKQIVAAPPIVQSGNTITVGRDHADSDLFKNIAIDYDVTTPRSTTLKAGTGSGGIEIGGIDQGAVTANTGSGSIHVDNIAGNAHLGTGSGGIKATNVHGAATLETGSGNIDLALTAPGDVKAQAGSGSVHIDGVNGALRAGSGSGSLEVQGNPTAEWRLESGSGSIRLHLPSDAHFNLNAESGSGGIHTGMPIVMQGSLNNHHVTGSVNGGGPTVRASTGSGSITLN